MRARELVERLEDIMEENEGKEYYENFNKNDLEFIRSTLPEFYDNNNQRNGKVTPEQLEELKMLLTEISDETLCMIFDVIDERYDPRVICLPFNSERNFKNRIEVKRFRFPRDTSIESIKWRYEVHLYEDRDICFKSAFPDFKRAEKFYEYSESLS